MTPIYHFIIAFVVIRSVAVVVVTVVGNGLAKVVVSRIDFDVVVAAGDVNIGLKVVFCFCGFCWRQYRLIRFASVVDVIAFVMAVAAVVLTLVVIAVGDAVVFVVSSIWPLLLLWLLLLLILFQFLRS